MKILCLKNKIPELRMVVTWREEDAEAKGQTGHLQSSTESEASVTAKVA